MGRFWIAAIAACASLAAGASGVEGVSKPGEYASPNLGTLHLAPSASTRLVLPAFATRKSAEARADNQIGVSRSEDVAAQPRLGDASLDWRQADGGFAAQLRVSSMGAAGIRVALTFAAVPRDLEVRVAEIAADGSPRVVAMLTGAQIIKIARNVYPITHWTATTEGTDQLIELWSPRRPDAASLRFSVDDVSHLFQRATDPVVSNALEFNCHVDVTCIADTNVGQDAKAVARMIFTDTGKTFVCTGSLLADRPHSLTPLFATANHCISRQDVASTLETWFFYQTQACNSGTPQSPARLSLGATLLMANFDTDFTLLQLNESAPSGAFFLGWDGNPLTSGQAVFGIHHPDGSYKRYSAGTFLGLGRVTNSATSVTFAELFKEVKYTQGIVEGGSSGSPLLISPGTFEGTLFGSPSSNSCTGNVFASYSDFTVAYPLVKTFLDGPSAGDDYGDTPAAAGTVAVSGKLVAQINTDGDSDWFRFTFTQGGSWTVSSFDVAPGLGIDVRGEMYAADGTTVLASNDDSNGDHNFSMSRTVTAGTYYVRVSAGGGITGRYGLASSFVPPDDYGNSSAAATNIPINGSTAGLLGVLNDQDWFRLTFTEAGSFHVNSTGPTDTMGTLFASDGTTQLADNDDIDTANNNVNFGLTLNVTGPTVMYLRVRGFDGQTGPYVVQTSFTPTAAGSANFTDLWWAGASESGWGINLNHQGDTIFATLFTFAPDHAGMWLVASLAKQSDGRYTGALLRTSSPGAFNASPWPTISNVQVGTMTLTFANSANGTLVYTFNGTSVTKQLQRQLFGTPVTCSFTTASRASASNFQDLWFNPAESGWGINFTQQGAAMFATLFTYSTAGRDMWLVATLAKQSDGSFSGQLLRGTTGPSFDAVPWTVPTFAPTGTMRVSFADGANGTLTYSVDGVSVTRSIQRQVFGATQSLCQ